MAPVQWQPSSQLPARTLLWPIFRVIAITKQREARQGWTRLQAPGSRLYNWSWWCMVVILSWAGDLPRRLSEGGLWGKKSPIGQKCLQIQTGTDWQLWQTETNHRLHSQLSPALLVQLSGRYQNSWAALLLHSSNWVQLIVKTLNRFIAGEIQNGNKNTSVSLFWYFIVIGQSQGHQSIMLIKLIAKFPEKTFTGSHCVLNSLSTFHGKSR